MTAAKTTLAAITPADHTDDATDVRGERTGGRRPDQGAQEVTAPRGS
ncbi:hypothetical protein [Actinacidiphila soli]|nr:hypothetical protein [Actinacidiphila soli]